MMTTKLNIVCCFLSAIINCIKSNDRWLSHICNWLLVCVIIIVKHVWNYLLICSLVCFFHGCILWKINLSFLLILIELLLRLNILLAWIDRWRFQFKNWLLIGVHLIKFKKILNWATYRVSILFQIRLGLLWRQIFALFHWDLTT